MIYMTSDKGVKIIVLEAGNIEQMKAGKPAKSPDGSVLIAYTPDMVWLADRLMDSGGDAAAIAALIDESCKRPQQPANRPHHEHHRHEFKG